MQVTTSDSHKLTKQEKDIAELEELIQLYKDGTLPYDEKDVEILEDKLAFKKSKYEQVYQAMMAPTYRKFFFRIVSLTLWVRKIFRRK